MILDHLVELVFDITIIGMVAILGIVGVTFGFIWRSTKLNVPSFFKDKEDAYKERLDEQHKELHRVTGLLSKHKQKFKVEGEYDLDKESDLTSLAKSVLPEIVDFLPQDVQRAAKGLLSNPEVISLIGDIHKAFPNETKNLLAGFLKGGVQNNKSTIELTNSKTVYDPAGA